MRTQILIALVLAMNCFGGVSDDGRDVTDRKLVRSILPTVQPFPNTDKISHEEDLKICMQTVEELKRMAVPTNRLAADSSDGEFRKIYAAAWRMALRAFNKMEGNPAREVLIPLWNKGWSDGTGYVQISVLGDVTCRELMNEEFWEVFDATTDPAILAAMGYLIYRQGNAEDIQKATEKIKFLRSTGNLNAGAGTLQNGINWGKHRMSPAEGSTGPPSIPPPGI